MATTMMNDLIDPQVMTEMVEAQLAEQIKFTAIAPIDDTLEGQPGTTQTIPSWKYSGDAKDVEEGGEIIPDKLTSGQEKFTIKTAGKAVELTDQAVLSGLGNPVDQAVKQVQVAIANKIDNDILAAMSKSRLAITVPKTDFAKVSMIDQIEAAFLDDDNERNTESNDSILGIIFMNKKDVNKLRRDMANDWERASQLGDSLLVGGVVGQLLGWQIVSTRKVPEGSAIAVKQGALKTLMKRDVMGETDRQATKLLTTYVASIHYGVAVVDDTKLLVVNRFNVENGTVIEGNVPKQEESKPDSAKAPKQEESK